MGDLRSSLGEDHPGGFTEVRSDFKRSPSQVRKNSRDPDLVNIYEIDVGPNVYGSHRITKKNLF